MNQDNKVDYKAWAIDMCSLLDAIEAALHEKDWERALVLTNERLQIAKAHGLKVVFTGEQAAGMQ